MYEFAHRRYVVTGAASGIGHAVAAAAARSRAEVYSLDRNTPTAAVTRHIEVDLSNPRSIDAAVEQLDGEFDRVNEYVAGVPGTAPPDVVLAVNTLAVRQLTESMFDRLKPGAHGDHCVFDGGLRLACAARRDRRTAGDGHLRGGGGLVQKAHPQQGNAYNFSKEVTTVYAMSTALMAAQKGFRINAVLPGPVRRRSWPTSRTPWARTPSTGLKALLGRHATPDDIAGAVVFLASDAARWINGHALVVEGGRPERSSPG